MARFRPGSPDRFRIGWVGHLEPKKNPMLLMQIAQRLYQRDSRFSFHVAGAFTDLRTARYLRAMQSALGLAGVVRFDGQVADMPAWYADKGVLLSTSMYESFGMNIGEAMAVGAFPVVHRFPGAETAVAHRMPVRIGGRRGGVDPGGKAQVVSRLGWRTLWTGSPGGQRVGPAATAGRLKAATCRRQRHGPQRIARRQKRFHSPCVQSASNAPRQDVAASAQDRWLKLPSRWLVCGAVETIGICNHRIDPARARRVSGLPIADATSCVSARAHHSRHDRRTAADAACARKAPALLRKRGTGSASSR